MCGADVGNGGEAAQGSVWVREELAGHVPPGDVTPGDVTPGDVTPGNVTPGNVTPGNVTPGLPRVDLPDRSAAAVFR